jgi:hypothetical protein
MYYPQYFILTLTSGIEIANATSSTTRPLKLKKFLWLSVREIPLQKRYCGRQVHRHYSEHTRLDLNRVQQFIRVLNHYHAHSTTAAATRHRPPDDHPTLADVVAARSYQAKDDEVL